MQYGSGAGIYEEPWPVADIGQCRFYHTLDLPGTGFVEGFWDLRENVDDYLGGESFSGKSVIDVGAASGYLSFEMERRGARVIAFDMTLDRPDVHPDYIPYHDFDVRHGMPLANAIRDNRQLRRAVHNSFWFAHSALGSGVKVSYGSIYEPPDLGPVDVCLFGNVLQHLQNPLQALSRFATMAREKVIVTESCQLDLDYGQKEPVIYLRANAHEPENIYTWWQLTPAALRQYLEVLGFRDFRVAYHQALWRKKDRMVPQFTLVATRRS